MKRTATFLSVLLFAVAGFLSGTLSAQEDGKSAKEQGAVKTKALERILNQNKKYIVKVEAVIEMSFQGQSRERKRELTGTLLDSSGVVALPVEPFTTRSVRSPRQGMIEVKREPKSFKVFVGDDAKEYSAELGARSSRFGLAFLKIQAEDKESFPSVRISDHVSPELAEQVVWASRLGKNFDFKPVFNLGRVNALLDKPRKMWSLTRYPTPGHPVFNLDGDLIGIVGMIETGDDGQSSRPGMSSGSSFLLPASDVKRVLDRALKQINKAGDGDEENGNNGDSEDGENSEQEGEKNEKEE